MQKTFFQKTYNLTRYLFIYSIFYLILNFIFRLLANLFYKEIFSSDTVEQTHKYLYLIADLVILVSLLFGILLSIIISIELAKRYATDSILNYVHSIRQTIKLRQFLRQYELIQNSSTNSKINPQSNYTIKTFNKAVSKCTIDVQQNRIIVFLKYPKSQQAQKIFREMEAHIKEEISNYNSDYYFSSPTRIKNQLWYVGTKR
ncbi:hypothetical protein TZ90_00102 [Streptococcus mitis]|uniref:Uncharacterized protein n=1 Tax=Streptococcus mitis TaxID=28037 RepID=A0A0F2DHE8_STRMT|nr:hypothetical protein [Streptococcus mitis]KJQ69425.1 hypothetical protein TZ90_00102 [Streptococcus mitis]